MKDKRIRAWVLQRILRALPTSGRIVIVGHSLGSVIAADLVRRLPADIEVAGMITIGSPLAHPALHVEDLEDLLKEPPANLGWWVNLWSPVDPVPAGRGASTAFPWILDQRIAAAAGPHRPIHNHAATTYLDDDRVATAIGYGLFGSRSKEIVLAHHGVDVPLDEPESIALLAFRYAHLIRMRLGGETRQRFSEALRQVQAATVDKMIERRLNENRPLPEAITKLRVDLSDPNSALPEPTVPGHFSIESAMVPLVAVAGANVVRPFEIKISDEDERWAMELVTLEMGLGRRLGADVLDAIDDAERAVRGPNWVKWTALGVGAALIAASGGLALTATPGLAGAAAITSALASFGPGGMIGGLLTAGTLLSAGSGSIAVGLASTATSAETVEAVVAGQLAVALLREGQKRDQDPNTWAGLVANEIELNRELSRLTAISDDGAMTVKELDRKLAVVRRGLRHLSDRDLGPRTEKLDFDDS